MRKLLVLTLITLSFSAFSQEEYQETEYMAPFSEDEQIERGIAGHPENQGMEQIEPAAHEEPEPSYDYSAE
jgi:hypothetical protein